MLLSLSGGSMDRKARKVRSCFPLGLGIAAGLLVAFFLGQQVQCTYLPSNKIPSSAKEDFGLIAEAWNTIHTYYVDQAVVKARPLTYGAISGMVNALGDTGHSTFLSPDMIKEQEEFTKGKYKGIGAEVKMKGERVVIVAPFDGSPAQKAGLRPGDTIIGVNGQDTTGLGLLQVVKMISGPAGTTVTLAILDPVTGRTRKVTMIRASITIKNITWHQLPGTKAAHLRIAAFSSGVTEALKKALEKIKESDLKGLILDLRDDPGGVLAEAVSSASQFLSDGDVLLEKNMRNQITRVPVEKKGLAPHIPMVCLVNQGTASAAEILAGALQDHKRARLVGTTTFGTGTVLEQFPLSDGSAMLLAVEEWLTPDGNTIWHKGITPNVVVALPEGITPLFPEEERDMTPQNLLESKDIQLLDALKLLTAQMG
jgi:carboxyl-terminal processing protease